MIGDLKWLRAKTTLTPPTLLESTTEADLPRLLPKIETVPLRQLEPEQLLVLEKIKTGVFTDIEFRQVFKERCADDLSIRRARAITIYRLFARNRKDEWKTWLPRLLNLDYITVCNALLFEYFHTNYLGLFYTHGALTSLTNLQLCVKKISDHLKKFPASQELRLKYCESGGISGYRNPGFDKEYDFVAASRELAQGGEPHGLIGTNWLATFRRATYTVQAGANADKVEYLSLHDYIASELATTKGASTFGKVEWSFNGETGHFKARKNYLLDITTVEYLTEQTILHLGKQVNKSFIKAELGKMRIAVTGDLWTYFSQSWLNYLCGGSYLKWPGNTLDEDISLQTRRMADMLEVINSGYSLPFDFALFDHQPTTEEEKIQSRAYLSSGERNVPTSELSFWNQVVESSVDSFANATLIVRDPKTQRVIEMAIEGGVESGIRLTSLLGNYWNSTMTLIAKDLCHDAGLRDEIPSWLRGDDSAIRTETYWASLAMRLAYAGINAVGNDSKYGIHKGESEFLRIWYGHDGCAGYPNRALPGLMQRKPWASEPWDPEGVLRAQIETIYTLERRTGRKCDDLRNVITREWSKIRGRDTRWLQLPETLGGLNILPFRGDVIGTAWPKVDHPKIEFTNIQTGSEGRYAKGLEQWRPTEKELKEIQHMSLMSKTASDDVRGVGTIFRDKYKKDLADMATGEWRKVKVGHFSIEGVKTEGARVVRLENVSDLTRAISDRPGDFGIGKRIEKWWGDLKRMSSVRKGLKMMDELKAKDIGVWGTIKRLEKRGLHRSSAIDFVFGKISGVLVGKLHPLLSSVIHSALARVTMLNNAKWSRETWGWFTSTISFGLANDLGESELVHKLFRW